MHTNGPTTRNSSVLHFTTSVNGPVLIVEDDEDIAKVVRVYLERAGFTVLVADDGSYGLTIALNKQLSLIVLDWMLPQLDGPGFMKRLRAKRSTPVIMLTAKGEEDDRLEGFALGVDDYVVKPFSPRELVARIKAVLSRAGSSTPGERRMRFDALTIDPEERTVSLHDEPVELTSREFELLLLLARNPRRVFTRNELLNRIWGSDFEGVDRVVDVHVSNLRSKLERPTGRERFIETVRGAGYRFAREETDDE